MSNPALWTAIGGCITALATLLGVIRHVKGPAHQDPPSGPPSTH